ncbi:MAG: SulP family inorganic anion transporter [Bacteroidota bacterium]
MSDRKSDPKIYAHKEDLGVFSNFKYDIPAGLVVFLVALPLCMGIALASKGTVDEAPLFAGLLAGIIGGLVIPFISRSPLSVSGPAAGLIAIVIAGIDQAGSWEAFLVAVFLGGLIQIGLGFLKAGTIAYFFPSSVIKGMLAAIGLILIRKQLPHAFGVDTEAIDLNFHILETFAVIKEIVVDSHFQVGAILIAAVSIGILLLWENNPFLKSLFFLPGALMVVILGVVMNRFLFPGMGEELVLLGGQGGHLVNLPKELVDGGINGFISQFVFPDFSALANPQIYVIALTIGLVASVETLLSVEAVDKLDEHKRQTPLNRELIAQGVANTLAGLLGALPITAVIVRSSANVSSGGRTRMSAFIHAVFLLMSVITIGGLLNMIPLASLAVILLMVGYKLARPSLFKAMYQGGWNQFLPFIITIVAVLATDLLRGIAVGTMVGIFFTIQANFRTAIKVVQEGNFYKITFDKDVSFLNKAILSKTLENIPEESRVVIDGTRADFIDKDIQEILFDFQVRAEEEDTELEIIGVEEIKPMKIGH